MPHNMLKPGARVSDDRFAIHARIGRGQFAEVYSATDARADGAMRAIKVESEHRTCAREARVMRAMGGKEHFPELLLEGAHEGMPFLAMELVGENLADVRGRRAGQRFGQRTTAAIARALLDALESLHGEGYVHRDVKPGNVCLGNGKLGMKKLYLIDFGLARKFTDDDGKVLAERDEATFRGTTTYASPHAHAQKEQSARDDLYSVLYVVAEAHEGVLPWKAGEKLSKDDVEKEKQACAKDPRRLCPTQGCPPAIEKFARAIAKLKYGEKPNYAALRAPFEEVIRNSGGDESPLDWETQPVPASQPVPQPSPNRSAPPPPSGPIPPNATYADVAAQNITGRKRERENSERENSERAAPAPQVRPNPDLVMIARREPSRLPPHIADAVRGIVSRFPLDEALAVASGLVSFALERCIERDPAFPRDIFVPCALSLRDICFDAVGDVHKRFPAGGGQNGRGRDRDGRGSGRDGLTNRERSPSRDRAGGGDRPRFGGGERERPRRDDFRGRR